MSSGFLLYITCQKQAHLFKKQLLARVMLEENDQMKSVSYAMQQNVY